jgi:pentatricopeptide repeat protein
MHRRATPGPHPLLLPLPAPATDAAAGPAAQVGRLWTSLADYYIRRGLFEKARDVYEEGLGSVMTVRWVGGLAGAGAGDGDGDGVVMAMAMARWWGGGAVAACCRAARAGPPACCCSASG